MLKEDKMACIINNTMVNYMPRENKEKIKKTIPVREEDWGSGRRRKQGTLVKAMDLGKGIVETLYAWKLNHK